MGFRGRTPIATVLSLPAARCGRAPEDHTRAVENERFRKEERKERKKGGDVKDKVYSSLATRSEAEAGGKEGVKGVLKNTKE